MKEKAKEFLRAASADAALMQELKGLNDIEAILEAAKAHGFDLTAEDFKNNDMEEISEDEMKAAAGGRVTSVCSCAGGPGIGDTWELYCNCNGYGNGYNTDNAWRCSCSGGHGLGMA